MTALADLRAVSLTANAKGVVAVKGVDLQSLVTQAQFHVIELQTVLKQIVALHPSTGGDAANYAALNAVLAELAWSKASRIGRGAADYTIRAIRYRRRSKA